MNIYDTEFTHDWNTREGTQQNGKLSCANFTTLRYQNPKFYAGAIHRIWNNHNGKKREHTGYAKVIRVMNFKFKDIEKYDVLCRLDTGYNFAETRNIMQKMYKNVQSDHDFCFVLFSYLTKSEIVSLTEKTQTQLNV